MMHYPQCQSIDMLPVAEEKLRETLDATLRQISHLDKHYQNNTLLKTSLCHQLIERYDHQVNELLLLRQQCEQWHRQDYISQTQKKAIQALEISISQLEKLTQRVLFVLKDFLEISLNDSSLKES